MRYFILIISLFSCQMIGMQTLPIKPQKNASRVITTEDLYRVADSKIDTIQGPKNSLGWRNKNVGNLRSFKTGEYRQFPTLLDGYKALKRQVELYQSGESMHTDTTTNMQAYIAIYAPPSVGSGNYLRSMCKWLNVTPQTKIKNISSDSLIRYHVKMECVNLYQLIYETN